MSSFRVAPLCGGRTRFEGMKNLSSCLDGGCENYLVENTMRGKRHYALPLHGAVQLELLTFPSTTAKQHCLKLTVTPLGLRPRQSAALPLRVTRGEALPRL